MEHQAFELHSLLLYRRILDDDILKKAMQLIAAWEKQELAPGDGLRNIYFQLCGELITYSQKKNLTGDLWKNYILRSITESENVFSLACENRESDLKPGILSLARHDLSSLHKLYLLDWVELGRKLGVDGLDVMSDYDGGRELKSGYHVYYRKHFEELKRVFSTGSYTELAQELARFYNLIGVGPMGQFAAFKWDKGMVPIEEPDPIKLEDLVGYEYQKDILTRNTESFLAGKPAHHILLFGPKGTGKSSSVKALLNRYATNKLRMIELSKDQLAEFGQVLNSIKNRGFFFIIFVDDLSFEDFEVEYKYIKSAIEGSLEVTPTNALIYVTSNRRHLIKENWSDRKYIDDEVHAAESEQEKLSLADRFGLTLSFHTPAQEQYLQIVAVLAKRRGLIIEPEKLRAGALQWERTSHGRSGRTAQQYIKHLLEQNQSD